MTSREPWRPTRIKYISDCNAEVLPEDTDREFAFTYVDISDVSQGSMDIDSEPIEFGNAPSRARRLAEPGDTVVSTVRTYLRAVATVPLTDASLVFSTGFAILHPREDVHPPYLSYYLQGDEFIDRIVAASTGVSYPATTATQLKNMAVRLPPLAEQRAIADYLDRETAQIDTLITKQQQLISTLRERRSATVNAAMTDGSRTLSTRLKHVASIQSGATLSGEGNPDDPEWPYLRVANVQVGHIDLTHITTLRLAETAAANSTLRPGDVLMTEGGDIDKLGRGALWRGEIDPMLHQNHVFAVRPSTHLLPEFLVYWLDAVPARDYFRITAKKTTNLASTNKWTLGNLPVPSRPLDEQMAIVAHLDERTAKIDALIAKTERFIELAKERRTALITAAVTGQIDVRDRSATKVTRDVTPG